MILSSYSSWTANTDLIDLDPETVADVPERTRKDLLEACQIAAEKHDLAYFKHMLVEFEESVAREQAEREAQEEAKKAKKATKNKRKSEALVKDDDEDTEMVDAGAEEEASEEKPKKKRKTGEAAGASVRLQLFNKARRTDCDLDTKPSREEEEDYYQAYYYTKGKWKRHTKVGS
jgi:hypothetical protein